MEHQVFSFKRADGGVGIQLLSKEVTEPVGDYRTPGTEDWKEEGSVEIDGEAEYMLGDCFEEV